MLVDTHAHLYWDSYNLDFDIVIQRCLERDVKLIINIGTDLETSRKAIDLQSNKIKFYATIGLHPHEAEKFKSDESIHSLIDNLENLYQGNKGKVIGLGECGLDYFFHPDHSPQNPDQIKDLQLKLYTAQVELAKKLKLPLVIHCREAWSDIFLPELNATTGVFHNFSGTKGESLQALELGYYLSFSCILTYPKNQPLRELIKDIPLDKILTETDCPFLPPQQIRGQRNDPSNIPEVIRVIAEVKGISEKKVEASVLENTLKLFKLDSINQKPI